MRPMGNETRLERLTRRTYRVRLARPAVSESSRPALLAPAIWRVIPGETTPARDGRSSSPDPEAVRGG